jgi:hypothetical protein
VNCAMTYVFLLLVAICIGVIICAGCTGPKSDPCGVNETAKSRADAAVNAFDDAFPRQPISQESP